METEFLLVIDGISIDDDDAVITLADEFDALLSLSHGVHRLAVTANGLNSIDALGGLLVELAQRLPTLRVVRLDPDLVGVSDIADRVNRSRQNVQQWVDGDRHGQDKRFPTPEGTVGRSLAWRWSDVHEWLRPLGLVEEESLPSRIDAAVIDLFLAQWHTARETGKPLMKIVAAAGDEHGDERQIVGSMAASAVGNPRLQAALASIPRENKHQITVVCAVVLDSLKFVIEQLGNEVAGVIAVTTDDDELRFIPIASLPLPYTTPVTALGLGADATVGDLVLVTQQQNISPAARIVVS